jgi:hypothetical protein
MRRGEWMESIRAGRYVALPIFRLLHSDGEEDNEKDYEKSLQFK